MNPEEVIRGALPRSMSEKKRNEVAEEIADALAEAGLLLEGECRLVEVSTAMMPVQTIEAYGLTLALDALGDAAEISHRDGLVVLA